MWILGVKLERTSATFSTDSAPGEAAVQAGQSGPGMRWRLGRRRASPGAPHGREVPAEDGGTAEQDRPGRDRRDHQRGAEDGTGARRLRSQAKEK